MQHKQSLLILKPCHILVFSKIECPFPSLVSFELLLCHLLCFSRNICFQCIYWQAALAAKRTLQAYFLKHLSILYDCYGNSMSHSHH